MYKDDLAAAYEQIDSLKTQLKQYKSAEKVPKISWSETSIFFTKIFGTILFIPLAVVVVVGGASYIVEALAPATRTTAVAEVSQKEVPIESIYDGDAMALSCKINCASEYDDIVAAWTDTWEQEKGYIRCFCLTTNGRKEQIYISLTNEHIYKRSL